MNRRNTPRIKTYYDDYGSWYDKERTSKYYSLISLLEINLVRKYGENKSCLEVGCGTGLILGAVSKFARDATGIDMSDGMLEQAKKKGLNVKQANAVSIPFNNACFDLVYSLKVLPHIPDIKKAVREMERVVRDNGFLILEFYNPYSMKYVTNHLARLFSEGVYIRYDSLARIKKYLPPDWRIVETRGVRIFTPFNFIYRIALVSKIFSFLEKTFCNSFMKYFSGYFLVVLKKSDDKRKGNK